MILVSSNMTSYVVVLKKNYVHFTAANQTWHIISPTETNWIHFKANCQDDLCKGSTFKFFKIFILFFADSPLLLPALRLFIPPLRLVSAAMWQVVQRGNVQDYGMVEEFVSTVSEIVPELLNADQKAQLLLGLRARVGVRSIPSGVYWFYSKTKGSLLVWVDKGCNHNDNSPQTSRKAKLLPVRHQGISASVSLC